VKIARTQNPLCSQAAEPTVMLCGEISRSNLHSVEWHSS